MAGSVSIVPTANRRLPTGRVEWPATLLFVSIDAARPVQLLAAWAAAHALGRYRFACLRGAPACSSCMPRMLLCASLHHCPDPTLPSALIARSCLFLLSTVAAERVVAYGWSFERCQSEQACSPGWFDVNRQRLRHLSRRLSVGWSPLPWSRSLT